MITYYHYHDEIGTHIEYSHAHILLPPLPSSPPNIPLLHYSFRTHSLWAGNTKFSSQLLFKRIVCSFLSFFCMFYLAICLRVFLCFVVFCHLIHATFPGGGPFIFSERYRIGRRRHYLRHHCKPLRDALAGFIESLEQPQTCIAQSNILSLWQLNDTLFSECTNTSTWKV